MSAASVAFPAGAMTTSTVPLTSETKNAHWCDTPRRRGFAVGSRSASRIAATAAKVLDQARSVAPEVHGPECVVAAVRPAPELAGRVAGADPPKQRAEDHVEVR